MAPCDFDLSWSETAKYLLASNASVQLAAQIIHTHPDRFLFGTDEVAPPDQQQYLRVYRQYDPLWLLLISGSGNATVTVSDRLDAQLSGSGQLTYYGNPPQVTQDVSGSGRVTKG